jgi:predicted nucleic acid-binding protein
VNYLIDTCVISELAKKKPNQRISAWISGVEESKLFLSVLTIGELLKGIEKLPDGGRRETLLQWVNEDLQERFNGRIAIFDLHAAAVWAKIQADAEMAGKVMPVMDSMIAATAIANGLAVATRNISDMEASGAVLINPWDM